MPFTLEELAEMAAADAEIEAAALTLEDYRETDDREVRMERKGPKWKKVAARKKAWYEANREKVAARKKAWYEANREKVAGRQKAYREANREKINAYMREYQRNKRAAARCARPDDGRKG